MAFAVRETTIANPATGRRKARTKMARHLSAKQIKAGFGGKRRQSALKTKRHSARTVPAKKRASNRPKPAKRRNLGELVSILLPAVGNPAKRRNKTMAAAKKHKKKAAKAQRSNAGSRGKKRMTTYKRHAKRSNPGRVSEYLKAGVAVVGGAVGSKVATQLVLGTKNTGFMGYGGNLVATGLLSWAAASFFKDKLVAQMVAAGGIAQVIVRAIGEQTPYGKYLAGSGVGDYQLSAFLTPQRAVNALQNAAIEQPGWSNPAAVVVTHQAPVGVGGYAGPSDWN